jgi:hypothetical protein
MQRGEERAVFGAILSNVSLTKDVTSQVQEKEK